MSTGFFFCEEFLDFPLFKEGLCLKKKEKRMRSFANIHPLLWRRVGLFIAVSFSVCSPSHRTAKGWGSMLVHNGSHWISQVGATHWCWRGYVPITHVKSTGFLSTEYMSRFMNSFHVRSPRHFPCCPQCNLRVLANTDAQGSRSPLQWKKLVVAAYIFI